MKIGKFLILLVFAFGVSAHADISLPLKPESPFRVYSRAEGLNQKSASVVAQDADGFIWVGTFGGLNRFDGREFDSFTVKHGLRHNIVQSLLVDSSNRLWVGDATGGLTLMQQGRVIRTFDPPGEDRGDVRSIVQIGDTLYIGSHPSGMRSLSLTDMDAGFRSIPGAPDEVLRLVAREDGGIYLISADGLHLYHPDADPAVRHLAEGVTALTPFGNGLFAVGDRRGRVGWLDDDRIDWLEVRYPDSVADIVVAEGSIDWVILESKGMLPYGETESGYMVPGGGIATATIHDAEGVLWLPTRAGLARYSGERFRHYSLEFEGVAPEVFSLARGSNDDFWFGTSMGLLHLDAEGKLSNVSDRLGLNRSEVRDIRLSRDEKTLWIAHVLAPIYAIDLASMQVKKVLGSDASVTMGLERDRHDKLWAGSYLGRVTVYDPVTDESRDIQIADGAAIYSLSLADDDYLWFSANFRGLYRIDTRYPDAEPQLMVSQSALGPEFFAQVVAQGGGAGTTVWLSSIQGGVFRYQNGKVEQVIADAWITEYTIYSIQPLADDSLVLVTNRGVLRYDLQTKALEQYTALDGFTALEGKAHANYYEGGDNLLIGTTSGVTLMDTSVPMTGVGVPKPLITDRVVDDAYVSKLSPAPDGAAFRKVVIGFTALSTRNPSGVEFSYRLVGVDNAWSTPGEAVSISYSELSPGSYRFELRARLPGGQWSDSTRWSFTVPTPIWLSWWFLALASLGMLALLWALTQLRLRAIAHTNQRLREEVAERTRSIEAGRRELEVANERLSNEIQERQKADALREEVEIRFHQAYQNSPIGMALVDPDGLVYNANPKMKRLFWPCSTPDDREPLIQVIAEEDRDAFARFLAACASGDAQDSSMEADCVASDGHERRVDFRPAAIRDNEGRLKHIVLLAHDVTESRAMTDQLEYQASFDELTGLLNRRAFAQRLEEVDSESAGEAFLMFLDLDQFKIVNDTCGHAAGDDLLQKVARLICECVRERDIVARLGGDEFAIILVDCNEEVAMQRAEYIRQRVADLEFLWDHEVFRIGVSIGVVPMAQASRDLNELQQVADAACYAAKDAGRNRVHLVSGTEDAVHARRGEMRWVQRLNHAINSDGFVLYGQRIAPLCDDLAREERIEVLLRMRERGSERLIPPGAFLPAAERYGLQGRLDLWVVNKVIEVLRERGDSQAGRQRVWVNLSGATIGDPRVSRELVQLLEDADLPAGCLNFEITETAVIRNIDDATTLIQTLQARGCRFALDDFGSGLSSFGYLRKLNVDYLKIDGQFVRDIVADPTDRTFVRSLIDISHSLGMRVVTEFVENQGTLQLVEELGSDYAQGFHIHRPEPLTGLIPEARREESASRRA